MSRYLDKFISTMPNSQAQHLFNILTELKEDGTIRTVEEYNNKLKELSAELKKDTPEPLFKLFFAILGDVIDSGRFNAMVKSTTADLHTGFTEIGQINTVLDLHKVLFKLTVLKSLRKAVQELQDKISLYEFLNSSSLGFSAGQFNTFEGLDDITARSDSAAESLYYDRRKQEFINDSEDAVIDYNTGRLVMGTRSSEEIIITDVDIVEDSETSTSIRSLEFTESSMSNMIDRTLFTYWVYPILLGSAKTDGVYMKLRLKLGGTHDVNILRIEPASPLPMSLERIIYVGSDGNTNTISVGTEITKDTNIYLTNFLAEEIILVFKQLHGEPAFYYRKTGTNIWEAINLETLEPTEPDSDRLDRVSDELQDTLTNDELKDVLDIPERPGWEIVSGMQYTFGFDNIRLFSARYRARSVFVGPKMKLGAVGMMGLKTNEENPTVTIGNTDYSAFSFEYYVTKYNYTEDGSAVDVERIPILPIGSTDLISNERLWLVETDYSSDVSNIVELRFVPDLTSTEPVIKKNLVETLAIGTDYTVKVKGAVGADWRSYWTHGTADNVADDISGAGTDQVLTIQIKFSEPSVNSFYTANYVPALGRRLTSYTVLQQDGTVKCLLLHGSRQVAKCDLYLVAVLRRNYINDADTAAVLDYKLLTSVLQPGKYD